MEMLERKVTKKERIAHALLKAECWMNVTEIAEAIGIKKRLVASAMFSVVHDPRFDVDSKQMPNPLYTSGAGMITYYRCFAIYPRVKKTVVRKDADEPMTRIGRSDGNVKHLLKTHNPLWHQALCHRFGAMA